MEKPSVLIVAGVSFSGKSTVIGRILAQFPENFMRVITDTTRQPRTGEQNGVDYYFKTIEEFKTGIDHGDYYEWTLERGVDYYGVRHQEMERIARANKTLIAQIDTAGIEKYSQDFNARVIWLDVTLNEVIGRFYTRKDMQEDDRDRRINKAKEEMIWLGANKEKYGIAVIPNTNAMIDRAYGKVAEKLKEWNFVG